MQLHRGERVIENIIHLHELQTVPKLIAQGGARDSNHLPQHRGKWWGSGPRFPERQLPRHIEALNPESSEERNSISNAYNCEHEPP